ncbi:MAG: ubiquinol-cytochrome c reductase iron-sulfur subunit [Ignavibacteriales bacterium]|nr:ubiquinol-cytochrome c reductase iron-sulfur subunit [Ignavibacteriales bacterium]
MKRRQFFKRSTGFIGAASMLSAVSQIGCIPSTAPAMRAELSQNKIAFNTAIPELSKVGDGVKLENNGLEYPILLIRKSESDFVAVSTECMHLGCQVRMQRIILRCPCHGSAYDLEGKVLNGPTEEPLKRYNIRMKENIAEILVL